jgi:hypothetical protein
MIVSVGGWKSFLVLGVCGILLGFSYLVAPPYIFITALIVCAIFILAFIRPEYGFYLVIFVLMVELSYLFISIPPYYTVLIFPYQILLIAPVVGLIATKIANRSAFKKTPVTALLWAIEIISCIWAPNNEMAFWLSVQLLLNFSLFYVIINIVNRDNILRTSVKVWIVAGVVAAAGIVASQWIDVFGTIYLTNRSGIHWAFQEFINRPSGFGASNHIGGFVSTAFFLTLGSMIYEKRWKVKVIYLLIMTLMLIGVILTESRGAFLGLIGASLFFISVHDRFNNKFLRYSLISMILIVFLVFIVKPSFIDRVRIGFGYTGNLYFSDREVHSDSEAKTSTGQGLSGMEMRGIWWENALNEMVRQPLKLLFGLGIGGFIYYSRGVNTTPSPEVNSISFAFFYDMGMFGIILFILLLYVIVINLYHSLKNAERSYSYYMLLAATTAMIAEAGIHGLIDYDLTSIGSKFFWLTLGFTMAVLNILKSENAKLIESDKHIKDVIGNKLI